MTAAINTLFLRAPAPAAERIATAVAAVAGDVKPQWLPPILINGGDVGGRIVHIVVGDGAITIGEYEPAALPTCIARNVQDVDATVERLIGAGFSVTRPKTRTVRAFLEPVPGFEIWLLQA